MAFQGREDDDSDEAIKAFVGALLTAEMYADIHALRQAYVKKG